MPGIMCTSHAVSGWCVCRRPRWLASLSLGEGADQHGAHRIEVQTCEACGGSVKIIAAIEDAVVIKKILDHLDAQGAMPQALHWPAVRAPPVAQMVPTLH